MEPELVYNEETQEWEEKPKPFITIECETEEDFEFIGTAVAFYKKHLEGNEKPQTNADRIRAMSDEELAKECVRQFPMYLWPTEVRTIYFDFEKPNKNNAINAWLEWLKRPA